MFCRQRTYPSKTAIAEEEEVEEEVRGEVEEQVELDTREADSVLKEVDKVRRYTFINFHKFCSICVNFIPFIHFTQVGSAAAAIEQGGGGPRPGGEHS